MDTEEDIEIKKAIRNGHSETDEGPYYHESWWESYKGGVKGKLGGVVIGAVVGAVIGLAAAAVTGLATGGISLLIGAAITGGFAAGGMIYSAHEFSDIGKVTGAVAAAHQNAEIRMKSFEDGKFSEIKREISELKSIMTGKKVPETTETAQSPQIASDDYRTTHCDDHCPPKAMKFVFWKIAAIGLAVGLAVGALLTFGGVSEHLFSALGSAAEPLSKAGQYAASMTAMGLFGASFGINRDIFRGIFDKTDLLFKGIFKGKERGKAVEHCQETDLSTGKDDKAITTVVYDTYANYPQSDTHHRDKVLASAKLALLSMDHTKSIPH